MGPDFWNFGIVAACQGVWCNILAFFDTEMRACMRIKSRICRKLAHHIRITRHVLLCVYDISSADDMWRSRDSRLPTIPTHPHPQAHYTLVHAPHHSTTMPPTLKLRVCALYASRHRVIHPLRSTRALPTFPTGPEGQGGEQCKHGRRNERRGAA